MRIEQNKHKNRHCGFSVGSINIKTKGTTGLKVVTQLVFDCVRNLTRSVEVTGESELLTVQCFRPLFRKEGVVIRCVEV